MVVVPHHHHPHTHTHTYTLKHTHLHSTPPKQKRSTDWKIYIEVSGAGSDHKIYQIKNWLIQIEAEAQVIFSNGVLDITKNMGWLFPLVFQIWQRRQAGDNHGCYAGLSLIRARFQRQSAVNHRRPAQVCVPGAWPPPPGWGHTWHGLYTANATAAYVCL